MLVREIFLRKRRMPLFLCALQHFLGALQWKRPDHLAIRRISRRNTVVLGDILFEAPKVATRRRRTARMFCNPIGE